MVIYLHICARAVARRLMNRNARGPGVEVLRSMMDDSLFSEGVQRAGGVV